MASGRWVTALQNSTIHMMVMYAFLASKGYSFEDCMRFIFFLMGDDNIFPEKVEHFSFFTETVGMDFDPVGSYTAPEDLGFLGMSGRKLPNGTIAPVPLYEDHVVPALYYTRAAKQRAKFEVAEVSKYSSLIQHCHYHETLGPLLNLGYRKLYSHLQTPEGRHAYGACFFSDQELDQLILGLEGFACKNTPFKNQDAQHLI
jgi:hypothetical protein